jgi:hypothetical protein
MSSPLNPEAGGRQLPSSRVPFGVNEVRLNIRQWGAALLIILLVVLATPWFWARLERFETGPDYRLPYPLSKDYWLWERRLQQVNRSSQIIVLGDSVVWGEYVSPQGTLSHFLDRAAGATNRFVNAGVNGLFPLAIEGLVRYYGAPLRDQKVILHCNLLWMTSPKADLSTDKEEPFNHARLVPQFSPVIRCYRADANERLSAVLARHSRFLAWVGHLQDAYFGQKSILQWTLEEDSASPPRHPNTYRNPLAQVSWNLPSPFAEDSQRGPHSPRHRPWSTNETGTTHFEWVPLDRSLQWAAFQRVVHALRARGNSVFVMLGPFNEPMIAEENRPAFRMLREGVAAWLSLEQVPYCALEPLPSPFYADASHPLTEGYARLAQELHHHPSFQSWAGPRATLAAFSVR